jgi:hypothetical protein
LLRLRSRRFEITSQPLTQGGKNEMISTATNKNQKHFIDNTTEFFQTLFEPALNAGYGEIEIRTFPKN